MFIITDFIMPKINGEIINKITPIGKNIGLIPERKLKTTATIGSPKYIENN
jgi:hypothetical protein